MPRTKAARGILDLKAKLELNPTLRERVRNKYRTKNTTGYSLNAFLDFDRAVDIFQHVLIGSEGTLAFIAEAVMNTVPDLPVKYTACCCFPTCTRQRRRLCLCGRRAPRRWRSWIALRCARWRTRPAFPPRCVRCRKGLPDCWRSFNRPTKPNARTWRRSPPKQSAPQTVRTSTLYPRAGEQALLWQIRAGMFPSVGSVRKSGTTVIIEDVAFPVEALADAATI